MRRVHVSRNDLGVVPPWEQAFSDFEFHCMRVHLSFSETSYTVLEMIWGVWGQTNFWLVQCWKSYITCELQNNYFLQILQEFLTSLSWFQSFLAVSKTPRLISLGFKVVHNTFLRDYHCQYWILLGFYIWAGLFSKAFVCLERCGEC
jgi:hypothetical protein